MKQSLSFIILFMSIMPLYGQPLAKHQWKDRLILVFSDTRNDAVVAEQLQQFEDAAADLKDRDLLIYRINPNGVKGPGEKENLSAQWFYENYRVGKDEFNVILIGKDGGEKLRSEELISPEQIFALIDTMPMRRAEMRRKEKGMDQD